MSKNITESVSKTKGVGRKDRQMLKQKHRRQLQEAKLQQQRQEAKAQSIDFSYAVQKLKQTGLVTAYEQYLRSICKNGLPEPANVYQLAAQFILKFEKKHKMKMQKKQQLEKHNKDHLQSSIHYDSIEFPQKGHQTTLQNSKK